MHRDDMPDPGLQLHLHVVVPRRQVADIRVELEPRVVKIVRVTQRLADGVHQRVIHDLHRQRHLRAACHLNALFQAVTETTTRFVIGFLIVNVVARQLDHANTDILGELDSFAHNLQPLRPHCVIFAAQRETTMSRKAHGRHAHAGFNNRVHQRQTLLAAPVEARQAIVRFIYRNLDKIEA